MQEEIRAILASCYACNRPIDIPILLPCGHITCEGCYLKIEGCRVCKESFVCAGKVNVVLRTILSSNSGTLDSIHTHFFDESLCERDRWCSACQKYFCSICWALTHESTKQMEMHSYMNQAKIYDIENSLICLKHGERATKWCANDDALLCDQCLNNHQKHVVGTFSFHRSGIVEHFRKEISKRISNPGETSTTKVISANIISTINLLLNKMCFAMFQGERPGEALNFWSALNRLIIPHLDSLNKSNISSKPTNQGPEVSSQE